MGIIFCTVEINIRTNSLKDLARDRNHPWNGAAPNLIIILIAINNSRV
jgi:hypothetical protein